jgi:hypothetical protein
VHDPESDLFSPSLAEYRPTTPDRPPFRLDSQFGLAFLGGPAAVTAIAVLNARRLRLSNRLQRSMVIGGILVTLLEFGIAWTAIVSYGHDSDPGVRAKLLPRWSLALINLLWAAALVRWQTPAARQYELLDRGEYASMRGPGFVAGLLSVVVLVIPFVWLLWVTGKLSWLF